VGGVWGARRQRCRRVMAREDSLELEFRGGGGPLAGGRSRRALLQSSAHAVNRRWPQHAVWIMAEMELPVRKRENLGRRRR
jgi:hypothetical protein